MGADVSYSAHWYVAYHYLQPELMCILDTEHRQRSNVSSSSIGDLPALDSLGVVANALHGSRMISVVEHQATVESGLKMRIKRKNLNSSLTSAAKVISGADGLFEALENGDTREEETVLPVLSKDSHSDGNHATAKRNKKCRKTSRGNLSSHGSSRSRKNVRSFVHQVESVTSGDGVTESCWRHGKDFSDTQESSNMGESTETENDRPLKASNGTSVAPQSLRSNALPEKKRLKEIGDSEGAESEDNDSNRKLTSFLKVGDFALEFLLSFICFGSELICGNV